jgi:hypothetical protein
MVGMADVAARLLDGTSGAICPDDDVAFPVTSR